MKTTIGPVLLIVACACFGLDQNVQAVTPAPDGGYPNGNTAEGKNALFSLTAGGYNTAVGYLSLFENTAGNFNTALGAGTLLLNTADENTAIGTGALLTNTTGSDNTSIGVFALANNNVGFDNTADGVDALYHNTSGFDNTANGVSALESNTIGSENTAIGVAALESNTEGSDNTAVGVNAILNNATGIGNTAVGHNALISAHGNNNIAFGSAAGQNVVSGDNDIDIGNLGADESNTIRIGTGHTATYIAGIAGQTVGAGGTTCYVDNDGKLGVFLSARRYKQNIQPMNEASAGLYGLKPVTFEYKPQFDKSGTPQFGLIAEEVAAIDPDLVVRDGKGQLSTVRYEAVNVMLLNEFLKEHRTVQELKATVAQQKKQIETLATGLQKISAEVELNKATPQTVLNSQ